MSKYTDDLYAATGIDNAHRISRRYECPMIWFDVRHPHAFGTSDHRVTLHVFYGGEWRKKTIRLNKPGMTLKESRDAHLAAAVEWAAERVGLDIKEWAPTGFSDSWMPKDVKDGMKAELAAWRKTQRTES